MPNFIQTFGVQNPDGSYILSTGRQSIITSLLAAGTFAGSILQSFTADLRTGRKGAIFGWSLLFVSGRGLRLGNDLWWMMECWIDYGTCVIDYRMYHPSFLQQLVSAHPTFRQQSKTPSPSVADRFHCIIWSTFSPQLVAGRFIAGLGVGALSALIPLYNGETS